MKRIAPIALLLAASCTPNSHRTYTVEQLLQNASAHNQQHVRVCGILSDNIEYCGLLNNVPRFDGLSVGGTELYEVGPSIWVNAGHDLCMPGKKDPMSGNPSQSWAIVEGTFMTGDKYGHLDTAEHQIVVTNIDLQNQSCRPK